MATSLLTAALLNRILRRSQPCASGFCASGFCASGFCASAPPRPCQSKRNPRAWPLTAWPLTVWPAALSLALLGPLPLAIAAPLCPRDPQAFAQALLKDLPSYTNRILQQQRLPNTPSAYIILAGPATLTPLSPPRPQPSQFPSLLPQAQSPPPAPRSTAPSSTAPSSTAPSSTAPSSTAPSSIAPSSTPPSSTAPSSTAPSSTPPLSQSSIHQFSFTTLEHQYSSAATGTGRQQLQQFHQLILAQTPSGWQFVTLRSQFGTYPLGDQTPSPLDNRDRSAVAQAIRRWLNDCRYASPRGAIAPAIVPRIPASVPLTTQVSKSTIKATDIQDGMTRRGIKAFTDPPA